MFGAEIGYAGRDHYVAAGSGYVGNALTRFHVGHGRIYWHASRHLRLAVVEAGNVL